MPKQALPGADALAGRDVHALEVGVDRLITAGMLDADRIASGAVGRGGSDHAVARRQHGRAGRLCVGG